MQVRYLEYFAEIIRNGSINKAAKNLFISPQALSSIVSNLEGELGYPLLIRNRHGVTATEEGERIFNDLKQVLSIIGEWNNLGKKEKKTYMDLYVSNAMAASMNKFLIGLEEKYPIFSIMIHEARGKDICNLAVKNPHMMAVITMTDKALEERRREFEERNMEFTKLSDDEFCVVVGKDYFTGIDLATVEDCGKMNFIFSSDENDVIGRRFAGSFGHHLISKIESHSSILCMAALNNGAIILPKKSVECEPLYKAGMLRALKMTGQDTITRHYLLAPNNSILGENERKLKDAICNYYMRENWE